MLLKSLSFTIKAALTVEEAYAKAAGDLDRMGSLQALHADLAFLAGKHAATLGLTADELDELAHTDGGGTPKDA